MQGVFVLSHPFRRKKRKGWGTEMVVAMRECGDYFAILTTGSASPFHSGTAMRSTST
jgi:hypothetical protein